MALLRSQLEYGLRPENKDFQWPDSTEDLFDSFINPDSFNLPNGEGQRNYSNDFTSFFDTHASSSGSATFDVSTIPDMDSSTWRFSALSFEQEDALPKQFGRHLSIYSASNGRAVCSETDLVVLPTDEVEDEYPHAVTAPSTPRWRTKSGKPLDTPLTVRKRQSSVSPSKIGKTPRRVTTMHRISPQKPSGGGGILTKRLQDAAAAGQLDVKVPTSNYTLDTPPPSTQLCSDSFEWDFRSEDQVVRSPGPFDDELDPPMSPLSNGYNRLQHQNTPVGMPGAIHELATPSRKLEPQPCQPSQLSSTYLSSPLDPHPESFSLTPPPTQPMSSTPWSPHEDALMQHHLESACFPGSEKAELWFSAVDPREVTCGAPAATAHGLSSSFGLGISCTEVETNHEREIAFGACSPRAMQGSTHASLMHNHYQLAPAPRPRPTTTTRPDSAEFSASALSPTLQQQLHSMYPMSPLLEQHHCLDYTLSPARGQAVPPAYSPSPAMMQARQTYRPSHQRSHTVGGPISSIPPSMLTKPAYTGMSFPLPLASPSPPPRNSRGGPATSQRQRSKSAHHRRKSTNGISTANHLRQTSAAANVGFVNFTPHDSKRILHGVAPSGSSKTKARREKEAAEKRRKLSEAAKRAVLEAGGDLEALEREVLALTE